AACTSFRGFVFFEVSRWQRPVVLSWFDGSATQQNAVFMHHNRSNHYLGVGIGNMAAMAAYIAFHRVALGNAPHKMRAGAGRYRKFIVRHSLNLPHATGKRKQEKRFLRRRMETVVAHISFV